MSEPRRPADLTHRFEADSVGRTLALVGDHWTLMILREAFFRTLTDIREYPPPQFAMSANNPEPEWFEHWEEALTAKNVIDLGDLALASTQIESDSPKAPKRFRSTQPPRGPIEHARRWVEGHRPKY